MMYEDHASSSAPLRDKGVIIPEVYGDHPSADAMLLRLHYLGNIVDIRYRFSYSEESIGADISLTKSPISGLHISFHPETPPVALNQDQPDGVAADKGYFVLDTIKRTANQARSLDRIIFSLGHEAIRAVVYGKDAEPQPYEAGPTQTATINIIYCLCQALQVIKATGGYDALLNAAGRADRERMGMQMIRQGNKDSSKQPWRVFGQRPIFRDLDFLLEELTPDSTLTHHINAYQQYLERHCYAMPFGITPAESEALTARRYDVRLAKGSEQAPRPLYNTFEEVPRATYYEVTSILKDMFPRPDQLVWYLLEDPDRPFLPSMTGRLRTIKAVEQVLAAPIGETLRKTPFYNTQTIRALNALNIHTIRDMLGYTASPQELSRFLQTYTGELRVVADVIAQDLFYLPHSALIADALGIPRRRMPIYTNNPSGLAHEAALRQVADMVISQLPEPFATVITLKYLYRGTGLNSQEVGRMMGNKGYTWAREVQCGALDLMHSPYEMAPGITMTEALLAVLGPSYATIVPTIEKGCQDRQLINRFEENALRVLRDWEADINGMDDITPELTQKLREQAQQLAGDIPFDRLKLPYTSEYADIRKRISAFNHLIGKIHQRLAEPKTVDTARTMQYAGSMERFVERAAAIQAML